MKCLEIRPSKLSGSVNIPPSKVWPIAHYFVPFYQMEKPD